MPRCAIGWIVLPSVLPGVGFLTSHRGQATNFCGWQRICLLSIRSVRLRRDCDFEVKYGMAEVLYR
jgi:hypothetical protein